MYFSFRARFALGAATPALAQSGGPYTLTWSTIDGGGVTFATGGSYSVGCTIGQPDAGKLAGGVYTLEGGFWNGTGTWCQPDCNLDGVLTVADFGCFQTKFVQGDPYADCNADGNLTVADFGCFQTKFVAGCP